MQRTTDVCRVVTHQVLLLACLYRITCARIKHVSYIFFGLIRTDIKAGYFATATLLCIGTHELQPDRV